MDWLQLAGGDTNVDAVHRLIDWLSPRGHGICSSVDWNDASALSMVAMQYKENIPEKTVSNRKRFHSLRAFKKMKKNYVQTKA